jgi:hypothetical protein
MTNGKDDDHTKIRREIHPKATEAGQDISGGGETRIIFTGRPGPESSPDGDRRPAGGGDQNRTIMHRVSRESGATTMHSSGEPKANEHVTGWLVAIGGPGKGAAVPVLEGMSSVGRDPSQRIPLTFGDDEISREGHFFVTYEPKKRTFHINHGAKTNLVYLNGEVVLGPKPLAEGDVIEVGKTKLRFVPFCGPGFSWDDADEM